MTQKIQLFLWLFALVTSLAYLLYIYFRYGIQRSISASYNRLEGVSKSLYGWCMVCIGVPMAMVGDNWMSAVAGIILSITFAAPTGGSKLNQAIHNISSQVAMITGVAMLGFKFSQWFLVVVTCLTVLFMMWSAKKDRVIFGYKIPRFKNSTWWIEVAVLASVLIGLLIEKVL